MHLPPLDQHGLMPSCAGAGAEDDGYSTDGSEGSVAPEAQATSQSAEDLHFDEATRAAIEASLKDLQGTSEQVMRWSRMHIMVLEHVLPSGMFLPPAGM